MRGSGPGARRRRPSPWRLFTKANLATKRCQNCDSVYGEIERDLRSSQGAATIAFCATTERPDRPRARVPNAGGHAACRGDLLASFPISTERNLGFLRLDVSGFMALSAALLTARLAALLSGTTPGQNLAIAEDVANGTPLR